ncbi:MAG: thiopeptide-type bacteriocin biosynthesis protein, partial [Bacteroidetes bacterium]|nr:thiopeptide-type bacteriocin biosynthesis protein [Bacteroidota bacterium]
TILSLATWIIDEDTVNSIAAMPVTNRIGRVRELAEQLRWPRYISINEHDHQLVFDWHDPDHVDQLSLQFKADHKMVIKEFLPDESDSLVRDGNGQAYVNQFVATVYHQQEIYGTLPATDRPVAMQRIFVPGSEWLYYKLYLHEATSNKILVAHIQQCIRRLRVQGLVKKWFFVRYCDPGYHLRIRLLLHPKHIGYALVRFEKILQQLAYAGIIQQYQVDTYEREIERYGAEAMVACEDFFCQSTTLILAWMSKITADDSEYNYYYIALLSIRMMLDVFSLSEPEAIHLFRQLYEGMAAERMKSKDHNSAMKQQFREANAALTGLAQLQEQTLMALKKPLKQFRESLSKIAAIIEPWPCEKRTQLLTDLLHMHLNRLLVSNSRSQEMALYYYCYRLLESEQARKRSGQAVTPDQEVIDTL